MASTTVTLYRDNKLDQAEQYDPIQLADQFIAAVTADGYQPTGRSIEFAFRWWLGGPNGHSATWDEDDWAAISDPLFDRLRSDPDLAGRVHNAVWGHDA